jgi:hypothetical protein
LLPQSTAFAVLGYSCGGIKEKAYATGFDPDTGYPTGDVYLSTTCSTGGRGSRPATFTAWVNVTWDFGGTVVSSTKLTTAATVDATFTATDASKDSVYNSGSAAYLVVPVPAAPTDVTSVQTGDQFQVSWTPHGVNPIAITSSTLTATPVSSTAPVLTIAVSGSTTTALVGPLQPQTMYEISIVNTTLGGSGPASTEITATTAVASVTPSAPGSVAAKWASLDPAGTTDAIIVTWTASVPGDSPVDQYLVTISGSDGAGTFTQTVSATLLTASFNVDYVPNWSVTVQAHNAAGWGPSSASMELGGL